MVRVRNKDLAIFRIDLVIFGKTKHFVVIITTSGAKTNSCKRNQ
jgi:hypothetical protein